MHYHTLGRTNLPVSAIGLGTEYFKGKPASIVTPVIDEAISQGVNYLDIVFTISDYLENLHIALKGKRDQLILTGHIGSAESNGHYRLAQDIQECEMIFNTMLKTLGTDFMDIAMIQMVNDPETADEVMAPGGKLDLARKLKAEGKARFIGMSGHKIPAALKMVQSGTIDCLMFPINIAWDLAPGRKEILQACSDHGVGLVAMKPFGGGRLFQRKDLGITPVKCLQYILDQPGVSTVVPGVKSVKELHDALRVLDAPANEANYNDLIHQFEKELEGQCVYCNHCLPCPQGIDIGRVMEALDKTKQQYETQKTKADFYFPARIRTPKGKTYTGKLQSCTQCALCAKRCPFGVDVLSRMKEAQEVLG